jgi:hypothetical protein
VVNFRLNTTKQHQSLFQKKKSIGSIEVENKNLRDFAATLPSRQVFEAPLEHFSVDLFNRLLRWLQFEGCSFNYVLHDNANKGLVNLWIVLYQCVFVLGLCLVTGCFRIPYLSLVHDLG